MRAVVRPAHVLKGIKTAISLSTLSALIFAGPVVAEEGPSAIAQRYVNKIQAKVKSQWALYAPNLPVAEKTPSVIFVISAQGKVQNPHISKSSGNHEVDAKAVECVSKAGPFDPVPAAITETGDVALDMELRINRLPESQRKAADQRNAIIERAKSLVSEGKLEEGLSLLEQAHKDKPDEIEFSKNLADIYYDQAQMLLLKDPKSNKAIEYADRAFKLDPDNKAAKEIVDKHEIVRYDEKQFTEQK